MFYFFFSPILAIPIGFVLSFIWLQLSANNIVSDQDYNVLVGCFFLSSLIESLAEPLAILAMKRGQNALFAGAQSALLVSSKFVALILILFGVRSSASLCVGQVSVNYLLCNYVFRCLVLLSTCSFCTFLLCGCTLTSNLVFGLSYKFFLTMKQSIYN